MTAPDRIERQLSLARQGLTPPSQLRVRVRAQFGASEAAAPAAMTRAGGSLLRDRWRALRASGNLGLSVGAVLFALGCVVGLVGSAFVRELRGDASSRPPLPAGELAAQSASSTPAALESNPAPAPLAAEPLAARAPPEPAPATVASRERAPATEASERGSQRRSVRGAAPARDWRGELELLERAERAVRADNVALALALLGDFDARYPASRLVEERAAVETMAHCQAHATDGTARAVRFLNRYSTSLYRTRVEAVCHPETPASTDPSDSSDKKIGAGH